jgi:hypothetical protein
MTVIETFNFIKDWQLTSVITFFIGFYGGHELAIIRDKRKEFNEKFTNTFVALNKQLQFPNCELNTKVVDTILIYNYFPFWKHKKLKNIIKKYNDSQLDLSLYDAQTGEVTFNENQIMKLKAAIKELLPYFKPR